MNKHLAATLLAFPLAFASTLGSAAPINLNLSFAGTGFVDELGSVVPPSNSIAGAFSITFDPSLQYTDATAGLTVFSFTGAAVGSPFAFSYFPSDGSFYLGGSQNGADATASGTNDLMVTLNLTKPFGATFITCADPVNDCGKANGNQSILATNYTSVANSNSGFFLQASGASLAVPEPTAITLLLTGLAIAGGLGLGRKTR